VGRASGCQPSNGTKQSECLLIHVPSS
jgi:hypothetical protein